MNPKRQFLPAFLCIALSFISSSVSAQSGLAVTTGPVLDPATNAHLAGVLNLSTNVPSRVSVTALEVIDLEKNVQEVWSRDFPALQTDHSIPLLGFKPDKNYRFQITVRDAPGNTLEVENILELNTEPLPAEFPPLEVLVSRPDEMEPGYTLFPVFSRFSNAPALNHAIIVDSAGDVVWWSTLGSGDMRQLPNGNLMFMDRGRAIIGEMNLLGDIVRCWHAQNSQAPNDLGCIEVDVTRFHHEAFPTEHGTILSSTTAAREVKGYPTSEVCGAPTATQQVIDDPIIEFDQITGELVNFWWLLDMLDPTRIAFLAVGDNNDWAHVNAVIHDTRDGNDSIISSLRHQDAVIKFSRKTGELEWILGPHDNWGPEFEEYLLTPVGTPFEWQFHQHAPMITPQGTLVLFDNGNNRASPCVGEKVADADNYSRAVEYAINEDTRPMEITQVWEYGSPGNTAEVLYTRFISDADWLSEKENVLITFGGVSYVDYQPTVGDSTRIIEVDRNVPPDSQMAKVFELAINAVNPGDRYTVYRSERIPDLYGKISLKLDASVESPAVLADLGDIEFTATVTGMTNPQYLFKVRNPAGVWSNGTYGSEHEFTVTPDSVGDWTVQVLVRNEGSSAVFEAIKGKTISVVTDPPVSAVALNADQTSPVSAPGPVNFEAIATGGSGNPMYQFLARKLPTKTWTEVRGYDADNTFEWKDLSAGDWRVQVRARNVGSAASYEAIKTKVFRVFAEGIAVDLSTDPDQPNPAVLADIGDIVFTANVTGVANPEYLFKVRDPSGAWSSDAYDNDNTFTLTKPDTVGDWLVRVLVRNTGSGAPFEAVKSKAFGVVDVAPIESVSLSTDPTGPGPVSGPVVLTAIATGGSGNPMYQFLARKLPTKTWTEVGEYSDKNSVVWEDLSAGDWRVQVRARNAGSSVNYEAIKTRKLSVQGSAG